MKLVDNITTVANRPKKTISLRYWNSDGEERFCLSSLNVLRSRNIINFRDCNTVVHDIGRSFVLVQCPSINSPALEVNKAKLTILGASSIARLRNWNLREKGASNTIMRVPKSLTFFEKSLSPFPYYSLSFSFFWINFQFRRRARDYSISQYICILFCKKWR